MRAEGLGMLLVLAFFQGAAAQASPCEGSSKVLARAGAGQLGASGPAERRLNFRLAAAARVWAEADGVEGTAGEDSDAAPEAFLDDRYLGPLPADSGADWRSSEALMLLPGPHQLLVRRAGDGEGPLLRWSSLRVMGDAPCAQGSGSSGSAHRAQASGPDLPGICGKLRRRKGWLGPGGGLGLVLNPPRGRFVDSGPLIRLSQGETWTMLMKIPAAPGGGPLPVNAGFAPLSAGTLCFLIWVDTQFKDPVVSVRYAPDRWQPMTLSLCAGGLRLRYAAEPPQFYPGITSGLAFEVAAKDLALALSPAP